MLLLTAGRAEAGEPCEIGRGEPDVADFDACWRGAVGILQPKDGPFRARDYPDAPAVEMALGAVVRIGHTDHQTYALAAHATEGSTGLCAEQRMADEQSESFCTGFVVAPDLIVTAGHCLFLGNTKTRRAETGWWVRADASDGTALPAHSAEVALRPPGNPSLDPSVPDIALLRVPDGAFRDPLQPSSEESPQMGTAFLLGYPLGGALRFTCPHWVSVGETVHAPVSGLAGNSGSPLLEYDSQSDDPPRVLGMLVRGEGDFVDSGSCVCHAEAGPESTETFIPIADILALIQ